MPSQQLALKISLYIIIAVSMMVTRSHTSVVHLADITIPLLIIFGIYSKNLSYAHFTIIFALAIDNFMILYEGVSANCITPGYLILLASYYVIFSLSRFVSSIEINKFFYKKFSIIILLLAFQWFISTLSYYVFTKTFASSGFTGFLSYVNKWALPEILPSLIWIGIASLTFTLYQYTKRLSTTQLKSN